MTQVLWKRLKPQRTLSEKKAFGKNATKEDGQTFNQTVKMHNYLKKLDEDKRKQNTSRFQEAQYQRNYWKFAKNCVNATLDKKPVVPTITELEANMYFPSKYMAIQILLIYKPLPGFPISQYTITNFLFNHSTSTQFA